MGQRHGHGRGQGFGQGHGQAFGQQILDGAFAEQIGSGQKAFPLFVPVGPRLVRGRKGADKPESGPDIVEVGAGNARAPAHEPVGAAKELSVLEPGLQDILEQAVQAVQVRVVPQRFLGMRMPGGEDFAGRVEPAKGAQNPGQPAVGVGRIGRFQVGIA